MNAKARLLLENQQRQDEQKMYANTISCSNFIMQRMGLQVDSSGFIHRYDEEENEISEYTFDGKKCKSIDSQSVMKNELLFDPYNNVKLCCGLLQYYITQYLGRDTNMIFLSNKNMNEHGTLTVIFDDGTQLIGNAYNKDTLKYLDMILVLDIALPFDFNFLARLDI
jgi:hypothetical protein